MRRNASAPLAPATGTAGARANCLSAVAPTA